MQSRRLENLGWRISNRLVVIILLVAGIFRTIGITSRPIWYDEAFSILLAEKGPDAILLGTLDPNGARAAEEHPPAYYITLWLGMLGFGASVGTARAISILAGLIIVWLAFLIACQLFDETTALSGVMVVALNPFQVHYSQEIRMYSLMTMWLMIASYALLRGCTTGQVRWWIVFAASSALAQYTHNLSAFYLLPLAAIPLLNKDWRSLRLSVAAGIAALILYSPWLIQLPAQFAKVQQGYWVERPEIAELFTLLIVYVTNTPLPDSWIPIALSISLLVMVIAALQTIRITRALRQTNGLIAFHLAFTPPLLLIAFSLWKPVYVERALLPSGVLFCLWIGWVITSTNINKIIRNTMLAALLLASALGNYIHVTYRDFPYGPFESINRLLRQSAGPGDVIVHSNKLTYLPAYFFDRDLPQKFIADPEGSGADTLAPATQEVLGVHEDHDLETATAGATRVWYILFSRSIDEFIAMGERTHPDLLALESKFTLASQETLDGVEVYLFESQP